MHITTNAAPHLFWITSRAAGIVALVLASVAVALGLVMSLKLMRRRGPDLLALHEILSLGTLVAIGVHGLALLGDNFVHFSLAGIAVPFASGYRTGWTSIGIIAGWGTALLGLSYYLRRYIGAARWRKLHRLTALLWVFGLAHSLGEGTDAGQIWFLAMISIVAVPALALVTVRYLGTQEAGPRPVSHPRRGSTGGGRPPAAVPRVPHSTPPPRVPAP